MSRMGCSRLLGHIKPKSRIRPPSNRVRWVAASCPRGAYIETRLRQGSTQDGEQIVLGPAMKATEVNGDGVRDEGAFAIKTPSPY